MGKRDPAGLGHASGTRRKVESQRVQRSLAVSAQPLDVAILGREVRLDLLERRMHRGDLRLEEVHPVLLGGQGHGQRVLLGHADTEALGVCLRVLLKLLLQALDPVGGNQSLFLEEAHLALVGGQGRGQRVLLGRTSPETLGVCLRVLLKLLLQALGPVGGGLDLAGQLALLGLHAADQRRKPVDFLSERGSLGGGLGSQLPLFGLRILDERREPVDVLLAGLAQLTCGDNFGSERADNLVALRAGRRKSLVVLGADPLDLAHRSLGPGGLGLDILGVLPDGGPEGYSVQLCGRQPRLECPVGIPGSVKFKAELSGVCPEGRAFHLCGRQQCLECRVGIPGQPEFEAQLLGIAGLCGRGFDVPLDFELEAGRPTGLGQQLAIGLGQLGGEDFVLVRECRALVRLPGHELPQGRKPTGFGQQFAVGLGHLGNESLILAQQCRSLVRLLGDKTLQGRNLRGQRIPLLSEPRDRRRQGLGCDQVGLEGIPLLGERGNRCRHSLDCSQIGLKCLPLLGEHGHRRRHGLGCGQVGLEGLSLLDERGHRLCHGLDCIQVGLESLDGGQRRVPLLGERGDRCSQGFGSGQVGLEAVDGLLKRLYRLLA